MSKGGKRGKYHEWLTDDGLLRIESWASDGLTNEDIAQNMGIARSTLNVWLNKHSDISEALKKGREPVTRKLENALINNALGFEYEEIETWIEEVDGKQKKKIKRTKKHSLPDSSALMFLLKNYKPNKYRKYNDETRKKIEAETNKLIAEAEKIKKDTEINENQEDKLDEYLEVLGNAIDSE